MLANTRLFWVLAAFFVVADIAYIVWSYVDYTQRAIPSVGGFEGQMIEPVGALSLGLCAILSALIAFYLGRIHAAQGGELPEDRLTANIDDGDAEQGFFSPWSWWPIMLAGGASLLFLGIAIGVWIVYIGLIVGVVSLVGWMYEYYRGNFAH